MFKLATIMLLPIVILSVNSRISLLRQSWGREESDICCDQILRTSRVVKKSGFSAFRAQNDRLCWMLIEEAMKKQRKIKNEQIAP